MRDREALLARMREEGEIFAERLQSPEAAAAFAPFCSAGDAPAAAAADPRLHRRHALARRSARAGGSAAVAAATVGRAPSGKFCA